MHEVEAQEIINSRCVRTVCSPPLSTPFIPEF